VVLHGANKAPGENSATVTPLSVTTLLEGVVLDVIPVMVVRPCARLDEEEGSKQDLVAAGVGD
jgi:hypothetical protein